MRTIDVVRQAVDRFVGLAAKMKRLEDDPLALIDLYAQAVLDLGTLIGRTHGDWVERQRRGLSWYDHRYDWLRGPENWMPLERGVLGMQHICIGDRVLDLCCGDGFFANHFFATRASVVHGVDRNELAVATATRSCQHNDVTFFLGDIVQTPFPLARYDVVFWFDGVEHIQPGDGSRVLEKVARAIQPDGLLFGSTPLGTTNSNVEHVNEFSTVKLLQRYLEPYFSDVTIQISRWTSTRVQAYFLCWA